MQRLVSGSPVNLSDHGRRTVKAPRWPRSRDTAATVRRPLPLTIGTPRPAGRRATVAPSHPDQRPLVRTIGLRLLQAGKALRGPHLSPSGTWPQGTS